MYEFLLNTTGAILIGFWFLHLLDGANTIHYLRRLDEAKKSGLLKKYYQMRLREDTLNNEANPIARFLMKRVGYRGAFLIQHALLVLMLMLYYRHLHLAQRSEEYLIKEALFLAGFFGFYVGLLAYMYINTIAFEFRLKKLKEVRTVR